MSKRFVAIAASTLILTVCARPADAELITYTTSVVGSGFWGSEPFTNQLITLTLTTPGGVTNPSPGQFDTSGFPSITVAGIGTQSFFALTTLEVIQSSGGIFFDGVVNDTGGGEILLLWRSAKTSLSHCAEAVSTAPAANAAITTQRRTLAPAAARQPILNTMRLRESSEHWRSWPELA